MFFVSPIWLLFLGAWAGLLIWCLLGEFETTRVPFLQLWGRDAIQNRRPNRAWKIPPLAMILLLAGLLLTILAAAGPMIRVKNATAAIQLSDVRIDSVAVRSTPTTQAMVRLLNESDYANAKLIVRAGSSIISQEVTLPGRGETRNYFLDLPKSSGTVDLEVSAGTAGQIDHHLQITGGEDWPIVVGEGQLPPALVRMIDVYRRDRPAGEASRHVSVVMSSGSFSAQEPTAILMDRPSAGGNPSPSAPPAVRDSVLSRSINWQNALADAAVESPVGDDWQPIVTVGDKTVLATRGHPFREVWVGFDSTEFVRSADFVLLWSDIFRWLGDGQDGIQTMASSPPINTSASIRRTDDSRSISGQFLLSALGLMVLSAISWKASKVTMDKGFES